MTSFPPRLVAPFVPGFPLSLLLAVGFLIGAGPATAQTPLTALGLGYPVPPVDGRSAALGGTGIGLFGGSFSLVNPADMTQHQNSSFGVTFSGENVDIAGGQDFINTGRERFPVIRAVAPVNQWRIGIAFGSAYDQDWTVRFNDTLHLADGNVSFEETREHDGGISTIDLSLARSLGAASVGISAQRLTGSLRETFNRAFNLPTGRAPSLGATGGSDILSYSAFRVKLGANMKVGRRVLVSGVATLPSTLTADPQDSTAASADVDLPATVQFGASAWVVPKLLVAGSLGWGQWSKLGTIRGARAHDTMWYGGGIEFQGLSVLGGRLPVRFGARRTELPFSLASGTLDETAITGGFGWSFLDGSAEVNVGFESGTRGDISSDGLEESFQRVTVSFVLRQLKRSFSSPRLP